MKQEHKKSSIQKTPFKQANKKSQQDRIKILSLLKGRKKINEIESSLDVEIFLGCFSCPRVFFFLVRHMLFELLHALYVLYLGLHYPKRIQLEWRPHSAADAPLYTLIYHHT